MSAMSCKQINGYAKSDAFPKKENEKSHRKFDGFFVFFNCGSLETISVRQSPGSALIPELAFRNPIQALWARMNSVITGQIFSRQRRPEKMP